MATLTINFSAPTPAPFGGYLVKYRAIGTTAYTTVTPNPTSSPIVINGVQAGVGYEGTVQSDCGNGSQSPALGFIAYASNETYALFGNSVSATCAAAPQTVYLSNSVSGIYAGVTVYSNPALTTPLTTASYIMSTNGSVYELVNGVVSGTGVTCS